MVNLVTALSLISVYLIGAVVYALMLVQAFQTRDRLIVGWLSAVWPLSLLTLTVLLPLERTRVAPSKMAPASAGRTPGLSADRRPVEARSHLLER